MVNVTELIAKTRTELSGDPQRDLQYLMDLAKQYRREENAAEITAALAELGFSLMPKDAQEHMRKTTFVRGKRMDLAFHNAMELISEGKTQEAEVLLAEMADVIHEHFEIGDKKWFCFRNPFEYHLYRMYYPTVTDFDRAPFDFAHYLTMYGFVLLENHKVRAAAQAVERGIRFNPVNADVRFELAEIYKFAGNPEKLLQINRDTLRICTTPSRIARTLCNMGYYCVMKQEFYDAAVFYFKSLCFESNRAVEMELTDVTRRLHTMGRMFEKPTNGQILDTFEKYDLSVPPNNDLVNLAVTLGESARDHRQPQLVGLFYRVAYDLTNEPRFKKILEEVDKELGFQTPENAPKDETVHPDITMTQYSEDASAD